MRRFAALVPALFLGTSAGLFAHGDPPKGRDKAIADRLFTVADDFVIDIYHNGVKVPDDKRTLLEERFGATAERIDIDVKPGDWLVFNVVNNRMRWGGTSYFAVTGRGEAGVAFTTELDSGRWSYCDDLSSVNRFINDRDYLVSNRAVSIDFPWGDGDGLMSQIADGWNGKPLWGKARNTWVKFVAR